MATPHINANTGDFARTVLMPGDPLRAKFISDNFLDDPKLVTTVRNVLGFTGTYKGVPVSVMASGMGMPSIGIYSYELFQFYDAENIIRIGSAGSYNKDLKVSDVVLADSAYSASSYALVHNGETSHELFPSKHINDVILDQAKELGIGCTPCKVHSSDVFYGGPNSEPWQQIRERTGVDCVEMESFALFQNAKVMGKGAACLLTISDSLVDFTAMSAEERQTSFRTMMTLALEAAIKL
ncbi:MAG: purine-nucleoside phosphorylase [Muribaculaceae bacterium]|nr:purine-nucleoside phosphorylase [Muribaculaceae bacterium]